MSSSFFRRRKERSVPTCVRRRRRHLHHFLMMIITWRGPLRIFWGTLSPSVMEAASLWVASSRFTLFWLRSYPWKNGSEMKMKQTHFSLIISKFKSNLLPFLFKSRIRSFSFMAWLSSKKTTKGKIKSVFLDIWAMGHVHIWRDDQIQPHGPFSVQVVFGKSSKDFY